MQSKNLKSSEKKINTFWIKLDVGGRYKGASAAPEGLFYYTINSKIPDIKELLKPTAIIDFSELNYIDFTRNNYKYVFDAIIQTVTSNSSKEKFNLYISGDHFSAVPLILASQKTIDDEIAVIWIDAHADLHTPDTSYSGNPHGMPLAFLLGRKSSAEWWNLLQQNFPIPALKPENLIFIGLRSYEHEELDAIREMGIKVFSVEDVKELTPEGLVNKYIKPLLQNKTTYISFDIDALDASFVPGTGTPVYNGLTPQIASELLQQLIQKLNVKFLEITEYNPFLDASRETAKNIITILDNLKRIL